MQHTYRHQPPPGSPVGAHAGLATQELGDASDRETADKLLRCVSEYFTGQYVRLGTPESKWEGVHSCLDSHVEMPWYFLRIYTRHALDSGLLRLLVKTRPDRVREIIIKPGVEPDSNGTAVPEGMSVASVSILLTHCSRSMQ